LAFGPDTSDFLIMSLVKDDLSIVDHEKDRIRSTRDDESRYSGGICALGINLEIWQSDEGELYLRWNWRWGFSILLMELRLKMDYQDERRGLFV